MSNNIPTFNQTDKNTFMAWRLIDLSRFLRRDVTANLNGFEQNTREKSATNAFAILIRFGAGRQSPR